MPKYPSSIDDNPPPKSAASSSNLVLMLIVTPLYLIYHSFIKIVEYAFAGALFLALGDFILYMCGFGGFGSSFITSSETGALEGAVIAIPFSATFTLFIRCIRERPLGLRDEERILILPSTPTYGATTIHSPQLEGQSHSILYENQHIQSSAYETVVGFGLVQAGLAVLSPVIGALSGMVGSIALRMWGIEVIGAQNAAEAGGVGGLVWLLCVVLHLFGCQS
ncbi:hypothetical protein CPB86DRAFT_778205 [Serendipita vermifera]|nr:hypothetical protein CPB86DRAFT_778205 [Serendipita vermifera]